ncbi:MAG: hypothetical protein ACI9BH_000385 [Paracoccaceae bacterium]|jgi:hypothetical protein
MPIAKTGGAPSAGQVKTPTSGVIKLMTALAARYRKRKKP